MVALGVSGCASHSPQAPAVASGSGALTVTLSNFAFTPDHLVLPAGQPVTLHLVNVTGGGHDFSAPKLFAASDVGAGASAIRNGTIEVPPHGAVDLTLTPRTPADYDVVCTHALHELFGMTGSVRVVAAGQGPS